MYEAIQSDQSLDDGRRLTHGTSKQHYKPTRPGGSSLEVNAEHELRLENECVETENGYVSESRAQTIKAHVGFFVQIGTAKDDYGKQIGHYAQRNQNKNVIVLYLI